MIISCRTSPVVQLRSDRLTVYNFDGFLARVRNNLPGADGQITLDLRGLVFIDLFAMAGLAYLCADLCEAVGCRVALALDEGGACGFLPRAGFFDLLPLDVVERCELPPARLPYMRAQYGRNPALLEFTRIDSERALDAILANLIPKLHRRLKYSRNEALDFARMLSELCHNVLEHNDGLAQVEGIMAMQIYGAGADKFMELVVADRGLGIRRTLGMNERYADLSSDAEAIMRSTEPRVSRHDDFSHGSGLSLLVELVRRHRGAVHIRSCAGRVYYRLDREECRPFTVPVLAGTQFSIALPARATVKSAQEVDT